MKIKTTVKPYDIETEYGKISFSLSSETTSDIEWYVDHAAGDDDTGDGTIGNPFKSLAVLNRLPWTKKHIIKIHMAASDSYDYIPELVGGNIPVGGCLILDASDQTPTVIDGEYTVSTVNAVDSESSMMDLTVSGESWSPDQFYGKYLQMTSGEWNGKIIPIIRNTADTIRTIKDLLTFEPGDTFYIVNCPVIITTDKCISFESNREIMDFTTETDSEQTYSIIMCGIKLVAGPSGSVGVPVVRFKESVAYTPFCSFVSNSEDSEVPTVDVIRCSINTKALAVEGYLENYELFPTQEYVYSRVANNGGSASPGVRDQSDIRLINSEISGFVCRRLVTVAKGTSECDNMYAGGYYLKEHATLIAYWACADDVSDYYIGFQLRSFSTLYLRHGCSISDTNAALYMYPMSKCLSEGGRTLSGNDRAYSTYGIHIGIGCYFMSGNADMPAGTENMFYLQGSDTYYPVAPDTGNSYTDGVGGYVYLAGGR